MPRELGEIDAALKCVEDWLVRWVETKSETSQLAIDKAEINLKERLAQIDTSAYVTKEEFNKQFGDLMSDIRFLREAQAELSGKASQHSVIYVGLVSTTALVVSIFGLVLRFYKI